MGGTKAVAMPSQNRQKYTQALPHGPYSAAPPRRSLRRPPGLPNRHGRRPLSPALNCWELRTFGDSLAVGQPFPRLPRPRQPSGACRAPARPSPTRNTSAPTSCPLRRHFLAGVAVDGTSEASSGTYRMPARRSIASADAQKMSPKWPAYQHILAVIAIDGTSEASSGAYQRPARRSIARADQKNVAKVQPEPSEKPPKPRLVKPRVFGTSRGLGGLVATGWGPGFTRWGEGRRAKVEGAAC